jgi:hypothetical protein
MSGTDGGGISQQQINALLSAQAQAPAPSAPNWGTTNTAYNGPASFNGQASNYRPAGAPTMGDQSTLPPQLRNAMFSMWGAPIGTVDRNAPGGYTPLSPQQQAALYQSLGMNAQQAQTPGPGIMGSYPQQQQQSQPWWAPELQKQGIPVLQQAPLPPQYQNTMFSMMGAPIGTIDPNAPGGYVPFTQAQQAAAYQSMGANPQMAQNPGPGMFGSWPSATGNNPYTPSPTMSPQTMANVNSFAQGPTFGGFGGLGFLPR